MASGRIVGTKNQNIYIFIDWSSTADEKTNTSVVTASVYLHLTGRVVSSATKYGTLTIGDNSYNKERSAEKSFTKVIGTVTKGDYLLATHTQTVNHDSNGNRDCTLAADFGIRITYSDVSVSNLTVPATTVTLDSINLDPPTVSDFSVTGVTQSSLDINAEFYHPRGIESTFVVFDGKKTNTAFSYTVSGLDPNTQHSVQVGAVANNGKSVLSQAVYATTAIKPIISISLETAQFVEVGGKEELKADITPSDASIKTLVYKSSDTSVATVSDGFIYGISSGRCTITATATDGSGIFGTLEVTVKRSVTGIIVSRSHLELNEGTSHALSYFVTPADATNTAVDVESSDESVVALISDGVIKALKAGECIINLISADDDTVVSSVTCRVVAHKVWETISFDGKYLNYQLLESVYNNLLYINSAIGSNESLAELDFSDGYAIPLASVLEYLNKTEANLDAINQRIDWYNRYHVKAQVYSNDCVPTALNVRRWLDFCNQCKSVLDGEIPKPQIPCYTNTEEESENMRLVMADPDDTIILIGGNYFGE